ncbi:LysE family translocator [Bauldia sp.]|uniref:LysE family translocator n=1 Tax=Bauldia sp. TaxID=2575872 RepID=UPI003BAA90AD
MLSEFVPTLPVLAAYTIASVVLGLTPGPDMTLFLSKTVAQSRSAGLAAFGGAMTGLVIHTVLIAAGLSVLLATSETAFTVLKVVGAAYLAYLAVDAVRHGSALSLDRRGRRERLDSVYLKGLLVNLLNPKIIVFFVTFLPQFVSPTDPDATKKLLFLGLFFAVVNIPVCVALIVFADRIAGLLRRSPRITRAVDWAFATVLGAFAVRLALAEAR